MSSSSRPTASGKTLCYTLPVVAAAMTGNAKALYLFPTKALAQDQVAELLELNRAGELGVKAFTFDGDTPGDARQAIRLHGDIVVSNPDMLHQAILPHHTKWAQFFENLRYVVIDEVHTYRGVFGAHVANVLRRLKRICAFYGVQAAVHPVLGHHRQPAGACRGADRRPRARDHRMRRAHRRQARAAVEPAGGQRRPRPARLGALAEQPHRAHRDQVRAEDAGVRADRG